LTRQGALWLVPSFVALHNLEEAITFPHYLPAVRALAPEPLRAFLADLTFSQVLLALVIVTLVPLALTAWATARSGSQLALWLVVTFQMVMLINAVWHLTAAVFLFDGYAPGVITAVAVNVPFSCYLLRRAGLERWLTRRALASTLPVALVLHGAPVVAVFVATKYTRVAITALASSLVSL
jgi:uncharacterized protein with HXXEE motif